LTRSEPVDFIRQSYSYSVCQSPEALLDKPGQSPSLEEIGMCDGEILTLTVQKQADGALVVHTVCDGHAKGLRAERFEFILT
jgi:hypothetical protein